MGDGQQCNRALDYKNVCGGSAIYSTILYFTLLYSTLVMRVIMRINCICIEWRNTLLPSSRSSVQIMTWGKCKRQNANVNLVGRPVSDHLCPLDRPSSPCQLQLRDVLHSPHQQSYSPPSLAPTMGSRGNKRSLIG